ncbi:hypothetical protein HaLaN_19219 [Haematococcus lacustris]|uniref:Uncharacterized protein n=1 Tax=Haematococcus lacustris TaxID=44745 RepID=A0A699ZIP0_HAELA|nr:hypothetical protein HaLaN_19219 [Haematococcus lacustris]
MLSLHRTKDVNNGTRRKGYNMTSPASIEPLRLSLESASDVKNKCSKLAIAAVATQCARAYITLLATSRQCQEARGRRRRAW